MIPAKMLRKEQIAFGAALFIAALAFVLSKALAWFVLIIGLGLMLDFYFRDLIWGADRLTPEQIEKMPAEEYKARVLGNPKTEWWVNWQLSGRTAFKKHMRKLAREAVIFMLVTSLIFIAGRFAFLDKDSNKLLVTTSTSGAYTPPQGVTLDFSKSIPISCKDGEQYVDQGRLVWNCQNGVRTIPGLRPGDTIGPRAEPVPFDPASIPELLLSALWFGLYGIPAGLGLWLLYRAVYFAAKG